MEWGSHLNIAISEVQGRVPVTILHVDGRINLSNTDVLEQAAHEAYERGARDFLLDLNNVSSLTSAGLRSIHWIYTMVSQSPRADEPAQDESAGQKSRSSHIKLFTTSPHILKVLHVAGFDLYIDTYQDLNEAIAAF
jgi:anti-anti-sigma factor